MIRKVGLMDALSLESAVKQFQAQSATRLKLLDEETSASQSLVQELITEFGLGNEPALRRKLYERIDRARAAHPDKVGALLADALSLARDHSVRNKGNYFARAMKLKLVEANLG